MTDDNYLFLKLYNNQLEDIPANYRLFHTDILRLSLSISGDIFSNDCCYLLNKDGATEIDKNKIFYLPTANLPTRKLLYYNYVNSGQSRDLIKTKCKKGCITIKHFKVHQRLPHL